MHIAKYLPKKNLFNYQVFTTTVKEKQFYAPSERTSRISTCRHDSVAWFLPRVSSTSFSVAKGTAPADTTSFCSHSQLCSNNKTTIVLRPFVRDYPGEPVPEETFTHPPSWSSSKLHQLLPSTTIHSILPVQIACLAIFLHNLSPRPYVCKGLLTFHICAVLFPSLSLLLVCSNEYKIHIGRQWAAANSLLLSTQQNILQLYPLLTK